MRTTFARLVASCFLWAASLLVVASAGCSPSSAPSAKAPTNQTVSPSESAKTTANAPTLPDKTDGSAGGPNAGAGAHPTPQPPVAAESPQVTATLDAAQVGTAESSDAPTDGNSPAEPAPSPTSAGPASAPETAIASSARALGASPTGASPTARSRPAERLVLLAASGPILVDFTVTVDGEPHEPVVQRMIDHILRVADTNQDGIATWNEVLENPQFKYGQFGNPASDDESMRKTVREQYDIDRNQRLDREEVPRFLTRNTGSRAVSFTSSRRARGKPNSAIRDVLNSDGDSVLSAEEYADAATRLRTRDADEDDSLALADLQPTPTLPDVVMPDNNPGTGPDVAALITEDAGWDTIAQAFVETYGELNERRFSLTPRLFQQLEYDVDGRIDDIELRGLYKKAEPHVVLEVAFGRDGSSSSPKRLRLVHLAPELEALQVSVTQSDSQLTLQLPRLELTITVNDQVAAADFAAQAELQLKGLDGDSNGYLEASEVPAPFSGEVPFPAVDSDGNGKVYAAELAAYLEQRQLADRALVRIRASEDNDALFGVLDTNNDGRLGSRELERAVQVFASLDKNSDGKIRSSEIPDNVSVSIGRGGGQPLAALAFAPPSMTTPQRSADLPAWFRRMDVNRDGELGQREFLGDIDRFRQLDKNADGFIAADEI